MFSITWICLLVKPSHAHDLRKDGLQVNAKRAVSPKLWDTIPLKKSVTKRRRSSFLLSRTSCSFNLLHPTHTPGHQCPRWRQTATRRKKIFCRRKHFWQEWWCSEEGDKVSEKWKMADSSVANLICLWAHKRTTSTLSKIPQNTQATFLRSLVVLREWMGSRARELWIIAFNVKPFRPIKWRQLK